MFYTPTNAQWLFRFLILIYPQICNTTRTIRDAVYNIYFLTIDDIPTFVVPNTIFGIAAFKTRSFFVHNIFETDSFDEPGWKLFPFITLQLIFFNWTNLLIFDLANQRQAGKEDLLNKPWCPIPSGRMTANEMRTWLLIAIPLVVSYNHFYLQVGTESVILVVLTWMYNDLGGSDDNWIARNALIASGFGVYNLGSMKVVAFSAATLDQTSDLDTRALHVQTSFEVSTRGYVWITLISGVILTTMHVQDLKDVGGDQTRCRKSAPIVLGRRVASWTIAVPIILWSAACVHLWSTPLPVMMVPVVLGLAVAWRCVMLNDKIADRRTWQLWSAWVASLYMLPPFSDIPNGIIAA